MRQYRADPQRLYGRSFRLVNLPQALQLFDDRIGVEIRTVGNVDANAGRLGKVDRRASPHGTGNHDAEAQFLTTRSAQNRIVASGCRLIDPPATLSPGCPPRTNERT